MAQTIAEKTRELRELAPGVWTITYPLSVLGDEHGRVVTILALASGKLIIHSTGPFAPEEVAAIHELGHPSWLVEASLLHDTFSKQGRAAFPDLPYLGPSGLEKKLHQPVEPLSNSPMEWRGDVDMFELAGMPRVREFIFLHRPSGTLILGDLLHHFNEEETNWEHVVRHYAMGIRNHLGVPAAFPHHGQGPHVF